MPNPHSVVDGIQTLTLLPGHAPGGTGFMAVRFLSGRTARLDMAAPHASVWLQVLDSLQQEGEPAYVEVDPKTDIITRLLAPLRVRVTGINPLQVGGAVEVELEVSQARHQLRPTNPDFAQLLAALQNAQAQGGEVFVTETVNDHEIIDVRPAFPFAAAVAGPPAAGGLPPPGAPPMAAASIVTPARAQALFNLVNAQTCNALAPAVPCIPFLYPDDGCWGRAHEMCRLIIGQGETPEKVWIYGTLDAATR
ncbi:MAG TPA: protein-glutamine glutaminase family protein, partial [Gemmataceae bacterium]|nr:protein-glutamine glutaminase family protein [Gemmataceae bacterium]